jgi:hypothetical protein
MKILCRGSFELNDETARFSLAQRKEFERL